MSDAMDSLWWLVHDALMADMLRYRAVVDRMGLEFIDLVSFESLEEAVQVVDSIDTLMSLPERAKEKIEKGGEPEEIRTSPVVDSVRWIAAARKSQIRKVPMDWKSTS